MERSYVVDLRSKGKTYSEIQSLLGVKIPKSTLSNWCKGVKMSEANRLKISKLSKENLKKGREKALKNKEIRNLERAKYFEESNNILWERYTNDTATKKIVLAILYITEGHKNKSSIAFGNSDAGIISMFITLLRTVYEIDESKFRITVQCRADQNPENLKQYWSKITKISPEQFYKPQIDPRTIGKQTKKDDYKGVCRIDYFSASIDKELKYIARNLEKR